MMTDIGHEVIHYGGEGSTVACYEHVNIMTHEKREEYFGVHDNQKLYPVVWDNRLPAWQYSNNKCIQELEKRLQPRDFICYIGGHCQKPIADAFPNHLNVELV